MDEIKKLEAHFTQQSIAFYISFPPGKNTAQFKEESNKLYQLIKAKNLKTLGQPDDFLFNYEDVFNGIAHLNKKGVKVRVEKLARFINEQKKVSLTK